jgi:hypothetical protein
MTTRIEVKVLGSVELFNRLSEDARSANVCAGVCPAVQLELTLFRYSGCDDRAVEPAITYLPMRLRLHGWSDASGINRL